MTSLSSNLTFQAHFKTEIVRQKVDNLWYRTRSVSFTRLNWSILTSLDLILSSFQRIRITKRGYNELPGFVSMVHLQPGRVQWLEYLRCPNFVTHIRSLKWKIIKLFDTAVFVHAELWYKNRAFDFYVKTLIIHYFVYWFIYCLPCCFVLGLFPWVKSL